MEEAGFEPPVIFSRVGTGTVKERPRFIPQQQIQSADAGGSSGEMAAPPQSVAYSQQRMSQQGQEQMPSMGGEFHLFVLFRLYLTLISKGNP